MQPYPERIDTDSALMKLVQAIAITPEDARVVVAQYERQLRTARPGWSPAQVRQRVLRKVIERYARLAATAGGATALVGVVPGVGSAVAVLGGAAADVAACMKLQVDMSMCLAVAINKQLSNEDAKHLSFLIALLGTLEQTASAGATRIASKAGVKMLNRYLKGPVLATIKELFAKVGLQFARNAAAKAIPFGVGMAIGAGANYALTRYVGRCAVDVLQIHADGDDDAVDAAGLQPA